MEHEQIAQFVVEELGKHRRRSDVVMEVCERTGWDWPRAQKFVYQVAYERRKAVAARQSPLVIVFGVTFVIGGLLLALLSALTALTGISIDVEGVPFLGNVMGVGIGIVLIAGGAIGLWQKIKTFFE